MHFHPLTTDCLLCSGNHKSKGCYINGQMVNITYNVVTRIASSVSW